VALAVAEVKTQEQVAQEIHLAPHLRKGTTVVQVPQEQMAQVAVAEAQVLLVLREVDLVKVVTVVTVLQVH
jgi:fructosamine-3-kinase